MVSFSCEVCNDTVIKKKLDQHKRQCRGAYFTCIDCSTTFQGNDYQKHTQCISEAEKYEKGLYKGNKKSKEVSIKNQKNGKITGAKAEPQKVEVSEIKVTVDNDKNTKKDGSVLEISKYLNKKDNSLYKIVKKISKDNKKSTKDILKNLKIVERNGEFLLKL